MDKSLYSAPDTFSISPFLALLPVLSSVNDLNQMMNAMFARYENVLSIKKNLDKETEPEQERRIIAEEAMLKQVLEWMSVTLEER